MRIYYINIILIGGYADLKKELIPSYQILIHEENKRFKDKCQSSFHQIDTIYKNLQFQIKKFDPHKIHEIFEHLDNYEFRMENPNKKIVKGPWSETETSNLMIVSREGYLTKKY